MRLLRRTPGSVARVATSWLPLLLLFVVLVPSVSLLWFGNRAAQNEQLAGRQKLVDVYRVNLLLAQERLQSHWLRLAQELATTVERDSAPTQFARAVRNGMADAAICFDAQGHAAYPNEDRPALLTRADPRSTEARALEQTDPSAAVLAYASLAASAGSPDETARALQAQARALLRAGERTAALELITGPLAAPQLRESRDTNGRLIAPNAALMALELLPAEATERRHGLITQLETRALDYGEAALSSTQRRFLLRELAKAGSSASSAALLAAEDLALRWIAAAGAGPREPILRPAGIEGVWQFAATDGRIVLLQRTEPLLARLHAAIAQPELLADIRVDLLPPDREPTGALLSLPAGNAMPGWSLALSPLDPRALEADTSARSTSYLWIGGLTVLTIVILAVLTWELIRRQLALTRLRNDIVANVTHELKTPLSSMRLFVETLLNAEQLDERTTREYLTLIAQENLRLSRLIDNFLTFSRIERNKYAYAFERVRAARIAEDAIAAVRERFQAPGCTFTTAIAAALPEVDADADSFVTALINLLDNAYKYTGDTKEITLTAAARDGAVVFTVRDNGVGLSPRDAKRIFQRFYQVRPQGSPASGGCGLGLSIVHAIITAHRGKIQVESQPGCGSTFTITLPAAPHPGQDD